MSYLLESIKGKLCGRKTHLRRKNLKAKKCVIKFSGLQDTLKVDVVIGSGNKYKKIAAIIDTGCTDTSIPDKVAADISAPSIGVQWMRSVMGSYNCKIYNVDLLIGHRIFMRNVNVRGIPDSEREEMILGMDVLNLCDFEITKYGNVQEVVIAYPSISTTL